MTTSTRLGLTDLEQSQAAPEQTVNGNERILEQGSNHFIVKDKDLATPPGSPAESDAYIIAASPTGAWAGRPNQITWYENGAWRFVVPIEGTEAYVQDENAKYIYGGSSWTIQSSSGGYEGGPITAATTADLATWVNQGTSTVSDGTGAMILKPQVDGFVHGREKAAPSAPYDLYMKVNFDFLSSQAATTGIVGAAGILMRDNSDSEILTWCVYYERIAGDEQNTYGLIAQRWTNATTFSATPLLRFNGRPWPWIRVNVTSTTVTFYASPDGKNWIQAGTETISTFIDTIDRIGVVGIASANATEAVVTVPYFSTTAPS